MAVGKRRRRVLLVSPDYPPAKGGIQVLMERLASGLSGFEVSVLAFGQPGAAAFDAGSPVEVRRVASASASGWLSVPALNAALFREALRRRPDLILSGHIVASPGALLARRALGVPLVQYVHADEFRVWGRMSGRAVSNAAATVAVSRYTAGLAREAGAPPDRVHVIPPGVEIPKGGAPDRDGPPTLLTVATLLSERKGHDVIARALPLIRERVPGARWVVVGDGPLRASLEGAVAAAGASDATTFTGRLGDAERDAWFDRAQVFCMPSRVPPEGTGGEGFGIVFLEAGAHWMPVIGGDAAGVRDAVLDGETGLLVDPEDHRAVAAAASELLADPAGARRMGIAGRAHAEAHAWPKIVTRLEDVLDTVIAGPRRG